MSSGVTTQPNRAISFFIYHPYSHVLRIGKTLFAFNSMVFTTRIARRAHLAINGRPLEKHNGEGHQSDNAWWCLPFLVESVLAEPAVARSAKSYGKERRRRMAGLEHG